MKKRFRKHSTRPRWGWSGVGEIVRAGAKVARVVALLPTRTSSVRAIVEELRDLGARYHRALQQDEFGPARAERMQALRRMIERSDAVSLQMEALSTDLRLRLAGLLQEEGPLELDPFQSYAADASAVDGLMEQVRDLRDAQAALTDQLLAACENLAASLHLLDTTTEVEAIFDADWQGSAAEARCNRDFGVPASVGRLRARFARLLTRLERTRGPEPRSSLHLLVLRLCEIWGRETGKPVRANSVSKGAYTGSPQSASGHFICAAVEALQPPADWIRKQGASAFAVRGAVVWGRPGCRAQAVHTAMRQVIAATPLDPMTRRGRPRRPTL